MRVQQDVPKALKNALWTRRAKAFYCISIVMVVLSWVVVPFESPMQLIAGTVAGVGGGAAAVKFSSWFMFS